MAAHAAKAIGKLKGVCRANLGLAVLKGGKPNEALPVLEEAARVGTQVPVMRCLIMPKPGLCRRASAPELPGGGA